MNKINVVTDFAMEQNFRISNNQANIIKINNFIKNICDDSVFFREAVYKVTSEFKIYGELENHFLLDNSSRFIIQDVPMKISDIYIKENGFLVFFTHWNS